MCESELLIIFWLASWGPKDERTSRPGGDTNSKTPEPSDNTMQLYWCSVVKSCATQKASSSVQLCKSWKRDKEFDGGGDWDNNPPQPYCLQLQPAHNNKHLEAIFLNILLLELVFIASLVAVTSQRLHSLKILWSPPAINLEALIFVKMPTDSFELWSWTQSWTRRCTLIQFTPLYLLRPTHLYCASS